jgi:hypothetical protein
VCRRTHQNNREADTGRQVAPVICLPFVFPAALAGTLNLQRAASELAEKIAALPARYPYVGAAEKNVYLFAPAEAERDLIVQAWCAFAAASPPNGSA